jgi:hypothetical protein
MEIIAKSSGQCMSSYHQDRETRTGGLNLHIAYHFGCFRTRPVDPPAERQEWRFGIYIFRRTIRYAVLGMKASVFIREVSLRVSVA